MSNNEGVSSRAAIGLLGAAGIALLLFKYRKPLIGKLPTSGNKLIRNQFIHVVNTSEDCANAVNKLKNKTLRFPVLGFDCEWVTQNGSRHPIALLQLASHCGYCVLFRLSKIQHVPKELKALLEDVTILKVGVAPIDDAKYLYNDYAVRVQGTLDLRYLDVLILEKPEGLSSMANKHLKIAMDKDWRIRCSDWEAQQLKERQQNYAAADAHIGVILFKKIVDQIIKNNSYIGWMLLSGDKYWKQIMDVCINFVNLKFTYTTASKYKSINNKSFKNLLSEQQQNGMHNPNFKQPNRNYTRLIKNKTPYQNCYMQTSEGEILCTCDRKKAEWYIQKEIADLVCEDPFTIQLRFQPAGKCVGDVGRFYQMPRENCCVVCGQAHSYIRKNIIPKEYRRLFPAVMKDHSSHDVVLLCLNCHQRSNIQDQSLRANLALKCQAPICNKDQPKFVENPDLIKVKSAARALLNTSKKNNKIPEERKIELRNRILKYYDIDEITDEILMETSILEPRSENPSYESHSEIVVEYFKTKAGGLLELERMWREHFLATMNPGYMPELWSVTHTKSRLEIRATEGRVNEEDLLIAGLKNDIINLHELSNKIENSLS